MKAVWILSAAPSGWESESWDRARDTVLSFLVGRRCYLRLTALGWVLGIDSPGGYCEGTAAFLPRLNP